MVLAPFKIVFNGQYVRRNASWEAWRWQGSDVIISLGKLTVGGTGCPKLKNGWSNCKCYPKGSQTYWQTSMQQRVWACRPHVIRKRVFVFKRERWRCEHVNVVLSGMDAKRFPSTNYSTVWKVTQSASKQSVTILQHMFWWLGSCFHLLDYNIFGPFFNTLLHATPFEWTPKMPTNVQLLLCQRRYPGAPWPKSFRVPLWDHRFGSIFSPANEHLSDCRNEPLVTQNKTS